MIELLQDSYISYVNLDHRNDRKEKLLSEFKRVGLDQYPIERTRGQLFEERDKSKDHTITKMLSRPQIGAIGCFASQVKVMKRALEQNKHALVLEDDLVFCSDFMKRMEYIDNWRIGGENRFWDIIWLGGTFHVNPPYWHKQTLGKDAELTDDPRMIRTYGSFCTYAYLVNKHTIQTVLNMLDEIMPESIGIDWSMIQIGPKLYTYAFVPGCVKQYSNESDQFLGAYTDFQRFEKLNGTIENSAYWWQDDMNAFDPLTFDWAEAKIK